MRLRTRNRKRRKCGGGGGGSTVRNQSCMFGILAACQSKLTKKIILGAMDLFNKVIRADPQHVLAMQVRAYLLSCQGPKSRNKVKRGLNQMIQQASSSAFDRKMDPSNLATAYANRALVKIQDGDLREALIDLGQALAIDPYHPMALLYRAECNSLQGDADNAAKDYNATIPLLNSDFKNAEHEIKVAEVGLSRRDGARRMSRIESGGGGRRSSIMQRNGSVMAGPGGAMPPGLGRVSSTMSTGSRTSTVRRGSLAVAPGGANASDGMSAGSTPPVVSLAHYRIMAQPGTIWGSSGMGPEDLASVNNKLGILLHRKQEARKKKKDRARTRNVMGTNSKMKQEQAERVKQGLFESSDGDASDKPKKKKDKQIREDSVTLNAFSAASDSDQGHFNRGLIHLERGDLKQALNSFKLCVQANPNFSNAHNNYGVVLELLCQDAEAANEYQAACVSKLHPVAGYNLANVRASANMFGEAIVLYTDFIKQHTDVLLENELSKYGRRRGSRKEEHDHVELPENMSRRLLPLAYNNRAICYHNLKRNDEALVDYNTALRMNPDLIYAKLNRAHLLISYGDCYTALQDLRDVQKQRSSEYLTNLYEYCKRVQWAMAVACKDLVAAVHTLPIVNTLNLKVIVLLRLLPATRSTHDRTDVNR